MVENSLISLKDITTMSCMVHKLELNEIKEGKFVYVKELRGKAIDKIQIIERKGEPVSTRMLIKECLCDENGKQFLTKGEDVEAFAEAIPGSVYMKIIEKITKVNKFLSVEELKEEAKN